MCVWWKTDAQLSLEMCRQSCQSNKDKQHWQSQTFDPPPKKRNSFSDNAVDPFAEAQTFVWKYIFDLQSWAEKQKR